MNRLCHIGSTAGEGEAIRHSEALIKPSISSTQDGLWLLMDMTRLISQVNARRPIAFIANIVLRFPAGAITEG